MSAILAVGDHALVEDVGELRLHGPRGVLGAWKINERGSRAPAEPFTGAVTSFVHLGDPPRLAILRMSGVRANMRVAQVDETWIEFVDVITGEVQRRVDVAGASDLIGFAPGGGGLLANRNGCVRVDDGGAVRNLDAGPRRLWPCRSHDPHAFGAWAGPADGADGGELFVFDADGRIVASLRREHLCGAVLGAAQGPQQRAIVFEGGGGAGAGAGDVLVRFTELDLARGSAESDTVTVRRRPGDETSVRTLRPVLASASLDRVAVIDGDGNLSSFVHRRGRGWTSSHASLTRDIIVDVERDRVLQGGLGAYLRTMAGALVKTAGKATKWCFAGNNGAACVLIGGAVHILDETGTHLVDGPGDLVDLGPHPRGVVAVDDRDRAHVVEIA